MRLDFIGHHSNLTDAIVAALASARSDSGQDLLMLTTERKGDFASLRLKAIHSEEVFLLHPQDYVRGDVAFLAHLLDNPDKALRVAIRLAEPFNASGYVNGWRFR